MHDIYLPLGNGGFAQVDSDVPGWILSQNWTAYPKTKGRNNRYARRCIPGSPVRQYLHAAITEIETSELDVDHKDGDTLNNRRDNLRPCLHALNCQNKKKTSSFTSSRFKGVSLTPSNKWIAAISLNGRQSYLGSFNTEESAARAYDRRARELFGEFAKTNFIS